MRILIATVAAALSALATAPLADDNFYFRLSPPQMAATASSPPLQSTDSTTGITVAVPCVVCRVRRNAVVGFRPSVSGAQGPVTWSLGSGAPPAGTTPSAETGAVTGTAAAPGTTTFTLLVTDERAKPASSPSVTFQVLPDPTVSYAGSSGPAGRSVSIAPSTSALIGPATYALAAGNLPSGIALDRSSGVVSGTANATAVGLRVSVTDSDGATATSAPFDVVNVDQGSINFAEGTYRGRTGVAFSAKPTLVGMRANATLNVSSGVIPAGLGVNGSTGEISGTPSAGSTSSGIVLSGPDAGGSTVSSAPITIVIVQPAIAYAPTTAYVGQPYNLVPSVAGLQGPTFSRLGGTFPPGLTLSPSTGAISGTPTAYGTQSGLQVTAIDGDLAQAISDVFAIRVMQSVSASAPALTLARVGTSAAVQATYESFSSTPSWALAAGTLPQGMTLDGSSGRISGTPTTVGESGGLVLTASDGGGAAASTKPFAIRIVPPLGLSYPVSTTLPRSRPASIAPTTVGLVGTPSYFLAAGNLPIGLSVDPNTGAVAGTPSVAGTSTGLRGLVSDNGSVASNDFSITVVDQTATMSDLRGRLGRFVSQSATSTLITSPSWALTSGSLPAGVVAQPSGVVEGTPRAAGTFDGLRLTATGSDGSATTPVFRVQVVPALTIAAPTDVSGTAGNALSAPAPAIGGAYGAIAYALLKDGSDVSSTLSSTCPGLSFAKATGAISGTPAGACTATLAYSVSDDGAGDASLAATAASATFALTVVQPSVTASSNAVTVTEGDTVALSATTSLPNPTWSASGNPAWMTFTATAGTYVTSSVSADVTATATYAVTLRATSGTSAAERTVTVTVNPADATLAAATARSGGAFSAAVSETMAVAGTWSASASPSDVTGLAVSAGKLTGTAPAVSGTAAVMRTLTATHAANVAPSAGARASTAASSTLTVQPALAIAAPANRSGTVGTPMPFAAPAVTGKVGALSYALLQGATDVSGTLGSVCPGLAFSTATGAVSGTPTATCSPTLAYRVADDGAGTPALAATATSPTFSLGVTPALATASTTSATVVEGDVVAFSVSTNLPNPSWTASGNPAWMTFAASGADYATSSVSADVATTTTYTVTLTASSGGSTAQQSVTVTVNPASATLANAATRSGGAFSAAVSETMAAAGSWAASASPADVTGLAVSGSTLTGTAPANAGTTAVTRTLTATHSATTAPSSGARAAAAASSTLTVHPGLSIASQSARSGSVGNPLPFAAPAVTGKVGALTYAMLQGATDVSGSLGSVCPGLTFATTTGAVSGTPTAACSANLSYRVSDDGAGDAGLAASATSPAFALTVTPATVTASTTSTTLTEGDTASFSATTSLPSPTWSASGNPAWMTFTASSGTYATSSVSADVTTTATYQVTLTATSGTSSAQQGVTVTVNPAAATLDTPAPVRSGRAFAAAVSETMAAAGTWSASASPADVTGLAVSGSTLSGTAPANTGTSAVTRALTTTYSATAAPSTGARAAASASSTLSVYPNLTVAAPANRSGTAGTALPFGAPTVGGQVGALSYALMNGATDVSDTLGTSCPGLSFARGSGAVSGTPTGACSLTLAYRVSDDGAPSQATLAATVTSSTFTLTVTPAIATASTSSLSVVEGDTVSFSATTNLPNPTWTVTGNPAWMAFATSSGTYATSSVSPDVTSAQSFTVTMTATGSSGGTTSTSVSVTVNPATASLASASARSGSPFSTAVGKGMTAAGAWSVASDQGDVGGLSISGSTLSGTAPANAGPGNVTRSLAATYVASQAPTSGAAAAAPASGTLTVYPGLAIAAPADRTGAYGNTVSFAAPAVSNGVGTLTYALLQGGTDVSSTLSSVCPGLSFATGTGAVSGTSSGPCSTTLAYRVSDNGGGVANLAATATSTTFALQVTGATVTPSTTAMTITEGSPAPFSASTNLQSPTWSVTGGPAWLGGTANGTTYSSNSVSGDVTATTTYPLVIKATSGSNTTQANLDLTVRAATVTLTPGGPVRAGKAFSVPVSTTMVATGTWTGSASPADVTGLAVSSTALTGTAPSNVGTAAVTRALSATVTGPVVSTGTRATASGSASLTVYPALSMASQTAKSGKVGLALSFAPPAVTGAAGNLTYALTYSGQDISDKLGTYCAGMAFDRSTGTVSGTPTASCAPSLNYVAYDDGGDTPSLAANATPGSVFGLSITKVTVTANASYTFDEGSAVSIQPTQVNATTPVTWSISSGALPDGVSIGTSTGAITGTPTGTARNAQPPFVIRATGTDGAYGDSQPVTVTFTPAMRPRTVGYQVGQALTSTNNVLVDTKYSYANDPKTRWKFHLDPTGSQLPLGVAMGADQGYNGNYPDGPYNGVVYPTLYGTPLEAGTFTVRVVARNIDTQKEITSDDVTFTVAPAPGAPLPIREAVRDDDVVVIGWRTNYSRGVRLDPSDALAATVPAGGCGASTCSNGKRNLRVVIPYRANAYGTAAPRPYDNWYAGSGSGGIYTGDFGIVLQASQTAIPGEYHPTLYFVDDATGGTGRVGAWRPTVKIFNSTTPKRAPVAFYTRTPGATSGSSTINTTLAAGDVIEVVETGSVPVVAENFIPFCGASNSNFGPITYKVEALLPDGTWRYFFTRNSSRCDGAGEDAGVIQGSVVLSNFPGDTVVSSRFRMTVLSGSMPFKGAYTPKIVTWYASDTASGE